MKGRLTHRRANHPNPALPNPALPKWHGPSTGYMAVDPSLDLAVRNIGSVKQKKKKRIRSLEPSNKGPRHLPGLVQVQLCDLDL